MDIFIRNILKRTLDEFIIDKILSEYYELFQAAFTSKEFDNEKNYEYFEQLGDLTINKFIVTYMSKRFPHLKSSNGVGVLANLRILYGSKDVLSSLSEKFGFEKYVRAVQFEKVDKNKFKNILEDVFEAFFGALEFSMDKLTNLNGMGYITAYKILESMFDELDIKINYESLVDAKTRLNELKDIHKLLITYNDTLLNGIYTSKIILNYPSIENVVVGQGESNIKKNAQIIAAENALNWIEQNLGIKKQVPDRYKIVSNYFW